MKADVSKFSKENELKKNNKYLIMQMGRVLSDKDWNDYVQIKDKHDTTTLRDMIGKNGIPIEQKDSFKITPIERNRYKIGKGRMYVDGIQVENFSDVEAFSNVENNIIEQPYLPSFHGQQLISDAVPTDPGIYLAYLDVWYRHITHIEDPSIQESALGGVDTTTRAQAVWQVKLHKLEDADSTNEDSTEENTWAPWIKLDNNINSDKVLDIRIGSNNDGSLLEVFPLSSSANLERENRKSRRQVSLDPIQWETQWQVKLDDDWQFDRFDIALKHVGNFEILYTFGIQTNNRRFRTLIRADDSRWGKEVTSPSGSGPNGPPLGIFKLIVNSKNNPELFAHRHTSNSDFKIHHTKIKENSSEWGDWKQIGNTNFKSFAVTLNPNNDCLEIYAIAKEDSRIWYTKQQQPDSIEWEEEWKEINKEIEAGDPRNFDEIVVGLNSKKQIVIFVREMRKGKVWITTRTEEQPVGNGWHAVGDNEPGILILGSGGLSIQNNSKKGNRLELFGIFSESVNDTGSGKIWNIFEDIDGEWNSKWKIMDDELTAINVASATDNKSRVNIFAIQDETGIVHHSFIEDAKRLLNCEKDIPSWESKIKGSLLQLKARTRQGALPDDPCLLPEQAGYRRLENQLYRIEIHDPKLAEKSATFKYSRDNGSVCSKIVNISGEKITVASIGRDRLLGFHVGEWIEISDDSLDLSGKPGILVQIKEINDTELIFDSAKKIPETAKIDNDSFRQRFNPKARKWDSKGVSEVKVPAENNGWVEIEAGIEIKFDKIDICRTGDYFTIPARTLKADIEWPKGDDGLPKFMDIEGIRHHYAKLAFLEFTRDGDLKLISDCRDFFPPLNTLDNLSPPAETKSIMSWIHGTISEVEFPERLEKPTSPAEPGIKHGTGSTYRQKFSPTHGFNFNWFHFPLTISYPVDPEKKLILQKIYVLFESDNHARIEQIDIYDGGRNIKDFTPPNLFGAHGNSPDEFNTFSLNEGINQGIGISIKVSFSGDLGVIDFRSVGVQLKID